MIKEDAVSAVGAVPETGLASLFRNFSLLVIGTEHSFESSRLGVRTLNSKGETREDVIRSGKASRLLPQRALCSWNTPDRAPAEELSTQPVSCLRKQLPFPLLKVNAQHSASWAQAEQHSSALPSTRGSAYRSPP